MHDNYQLFTQTILRIHPTLLQKYIIFTRVIFTVIDSFNSWKMCYPHFPKLLEKAASLSITDIF